MDYLSKLSILYKKQFYNSEYDIPNMTVEKQVLLKVKPFPLPGMVVFDK